MATPPPPSPPTSPPPSVSASPISAKRPQPLPWTHEETVQLIRAYQEKWYKLRRGQLKSSQWEEVAVTVAARCGYDCGQQCKTAVQCRHKMEKLRQRHRTVKRRLRSGARSGWPFFDLMETLEQGPMPISSRPMAAAITPLQHLRDEDEEEEEEDRPRHPQHDDDDDDEENSSRVRSIDYILRRPAVVNRFSRRRGKEEASFFPEFPAAEKRPREAAYDVVAEPPVKMREMFLGMADEIRGFSKKLNGVDKMRIEIMREKERCWEDMEKRRVDMILQSEQKIVDSIDRAFGSTTKLSSS